MLDKTTQKVVLALAIFFAALIGLVVVVGLWQEKLDPTGVATLLGGILTGIMSGLFFRRDQQRGPGDGGERDG